MHAEATVDRERDPPLFLKGPGRQSAVQEAHGALQEAHGKFQEPHRKLQEAEGKLQEARRKVQELRGILQEAESRLQEPQGSFQEAGRIVQAAQRTFQEGRRLGKEAHRFLQEPRRFVQEAQASLPGRLLKAPRCSLTIDGLLSKIGTGPCRRARPPARGAGNALKDERKRADQQDTPGCVILTRTLMDAKTRKTPGQYLILALIALPFLMFVGFILYYFIL
jgi:hypothetical protein